MDTIFTNGFVWDGVADERFRGEVRVSGNRIQTVARQPAALPQAGAEIVDMQGGTLIPGLENQLFILTSYADGKPASAEVKIGAAGNSDQIANTDSEGVAIIRLKASLNTDSLKIQARDKEGNEASSSVRLQMRPDRDQILLRTEHAIYRAGDRIQLRIFSTKERGTAYVDVVKEYAEITETLLPTFVSTLDAVLRRQIVAVAERMWSTDAERSIVTLQRTVGFVLAQQQRAEMSSSAVGVAVASYYELFG